MTNYIPTDSVDKILADAALRQKKHDNPLNSDISSWWILTSAYQYGIESVIGSRETMIAERNELALMKDYIRKIEKADEDFEGEIPPELLLSLYKLARKT